MKKAKFLMPAWIFLLSIVSVSFAYTVEEISPFNTTDVTDPQFDGGQMIWMAKNPIGFNDVYYWDGQTVQNLTEDQTNNKIYPCCPQISNGQVVWVGNNINSKDTEIYFWNGATVQQLTNNETDDTNPQIDNGLVVWVGNDPNGNDKELYFWDSATGDVATVQQLTNNETDDINPRIDNGFVAWDGFHHNGSYTYSHLYLWDSATEDIATVQQLSNDNNHSPTSFQIDNGQVVWAAGAYNDDIYFWDGQTVRQVTTTDSYNEENPDICNGKVVWRCKGYENPYDIEIYFWDSATGDSATVQQLTDNTTNDYGLRIDNGLVVWVGQGRQIYLWDSATGDVKTVQKLTSDAYPFVIDYPLNWGDIPYFSMPQINNGQVVWSGYNKIYLVEPRPGEVLLFDFGAVNTATQNGADPNDPVNFWNNVTPNVGCSASGQLHALVDTKNAPTQIGLQMISPFNANWPNQNGTTESMQFAQNATRDSLYGNTEAWFGLADVTPSFKLTGLNPELIYNFTFYASRMGAGEVRETGYTVVGANSVYTTLDPANNIDKVAVAAGVAPDAQGEISISIAPTEKNLNDYHFVYLGAMKLESMAD